MALPIAVRSAAVGQKIALFDLHAADLAECQLYRVSGVTVTSQKDGDPVGY